MVFNRVQYLVRAFRQPGRFKSSSESSKSRFSMEDVKPSSLKLFVSFAVMLYA